MRSTKGENRTPAAMCRDRGWTVGTRIVGDEGYGPTVIEITAIGRQTVLAVDVSHAGHPNENPPFEHSWTLDMRDWQEAK